MDLPTYFESYVNKLLSQSPGLSFKWDNEAGPKKRLTIFKEDETGYDVVVEAETYGLYPYAGDWHGPAWEVNKDEEGFESLCQEFMGFIRSLLCADSKLEVLYAGSKPFKWRLTYPTTDGPEFQEVGLLFFNHFGRRRTKVYRNKHLPKRYE